MSNPNPTTLEEIIEEERAQLMIAGHVLGCASVAIEHDRSADDHAFVYADVIEVAQKMLRKTTNRLDSVYLRAFYEQLEKARRDLSQIEADASCGMTIATVGHRQPLLTINTGVAECGDISDGICLAHHSGTSADGWLVCSEGWWVMSFVDLEAIYHSAVAKRAAKQGGTIPDALTQQGSTAEVEQSVESDSPADGEAAPDGIASTVKLLVTAQDALDQVDSYVSVCLDALAAKATWAADDAREEIARVLGDAHEKLVLNAKRNVREALKGLGQDGGE